VKRLFRFRFLLLFVLQCGLIAGLRFVLPAEFAANENVDYKWFYRPVAAAIVAGEGIRLGGAPALRYPPGYPVLLSGIMRLAGLTGLSEELLLFLFTALCTAGSAMVLMTLSESIWGKRWGWISGVVWASYPFLLWSTKQPNSETPFVFLLFLSLLATLKGIKNRQAWLVFFGGVLVGFSMLIRPIGLGAGVLIAALVFGLVKQGLRARVLLAGCVLAGSFLAVAPWELWVLRQTGAVIPLSTGGPESMVDGLTFAVNPMNEYNEYFLVPRAVLPVMQAVQARRRELRTTQQVLSLVAQLAKEEPREMGFLLVTKAVRSWYATDSGRLEKLTLVIQVPYLLLSVLAVFLTWGAGVSHRKAGLAIGGFVLYSWGMTILVLSILRYTVPSMGLLFLLWPAIPVYRETSRSKRGTIERKTSCQGGILLAV
jgi:4-amino-4-deoxy-L-arabinose transferase-like glycosyltransferase